MDLTASKGTSFNPHDPVVDVCWADEEGDYVDFFVQDDTPL